MVALWGVLVLCIWWGCSSSEEQSRCTMSGKVFNEKCVITGEPARYRDPITGQPYATLAAFKILRERFTEQVSVRSCVCARVYVSSFDCRHLFPSCLLPFARVHVFWCTSFGKICLQAFCTPEMFLTTYVRVQGGVVPTPEEIAAKAKVESLQKGEEQARQVAYVNFVLHCFSSCQDLDWFHILCNDARCTSATRRKQESRRATCA